jgi:hypothetical protein
MWRQRTWVALMAAVTALMVCVAGPSDAASSTAQQRKHVCASTHHNHHGHRCSHKSHKRLAPKGPAKTPAQHNGTTGPAGPTGPQGVPGTARAYGLVLPTCGTCLPPIGFSPLVTSHSINVSLAAAHAGAVGAWCFVLGGGIDPSTATVLVSVVGPGLRIDNHFTLETAEWIVGAPDCSPAGTIEVRTVGYNESGPISPVPSSEIGFSFVVP